MDDVATESAVDGLLDWQLGLLCLFDLSRSLILINVSSSLSLLNVKSTTIGALFFGGGPSQTSSGSPASVVSVFASVFQVGESSTTSTALINPAAEEDVSEIKCS